MDAAVPEQDAHAAAAGEEEVTPGAVVDDRAAAFARLFEAVHEGVYIGLVHGTTTTTLESAAADARAAGVRPPAVVVIGEVVGVREELLALEALPG